MFLIFWSPVKVTNKEMLMITPQIVPAFPAGRHKCVSAAHKCVSGFELFLHIMLPARVQLCT